MTQRPEAPEGTATIDTPDRPLEDGWQPDTPDGDTLLRDFSRTQAAGGAALARSAGGRAAEAPDLGLAMGDAGSPCPFGNVAQLARPVPPGEAAALADALHGFYGAAGGGPFLLFSALPTPDLRPFGLALAGHPPFMVRPAGSAGGAPAPAGAEAPGLEVVEVSTSDALEDFERTLVDGYPTPELQPFGSGPRLYSEPVLASGWRLFVGYADGRPVAAAAGFPGARMTVVEAISVLPSHRGRGFGAAVTAAAAAVAPGAPAALFASDLGRPVYERLGFLPVARYTLWVGQRRPGGG